MSINKLRFKIKNLSGFNQDTVLSIMTLTRKALENLNKKERFENFAHLNFYCDWCVHSELTGKTACYISKQMTEVMHLTPMELSEGGYNDAILEILDLRKLRFELIKFFKRCSIPTYLFEKFEWWQNFTIFLREIISDNPIKFPLNPTSKEIIAIYEQVESIAKNSNGNGCKALWITTHTDPITGSWNSHWNIQTFHDHIVCKGLFCLNELPF